MDGDADEEIEPDSSVPEDPRAPSSRKRSGPYLLSDEVHKMRVRTSLKNPGGAPFTVSECTIVTSSQRISVRQPESSRATPLLP